MKATAGTNAVNVKLSRKTLAFGQLIYNQPYFVKDVCCAAGNVAFVDAVNVLTAAPSTWFSTAKSIVEHANGVPSQPRYS